MRSLRQDVQACLSLPNIYENDRSLSLVDQRLAAKIFIVLFAFSLLSLLLFTGLNQQTLFVTAHSPSLEAFEHLVSKYAATVSCSCSQVSIQYGDLVTFDPEYHQICSSAFVESDWISSLWESIIRANNYFILDYRLLASTQFQYLAALCRSANRTVSNGVKQFLSSRMISNRVLSRHVFETQLSILIEQLKTTIHGSSTLNNQLVLLIIAQNRLISALRTNYIVYVIPTNPVQSQGTNNLYFDSVSSRSVCRCLDQYQCVFPSSFYNWTHVTKTDATLWRNASEIIPIPGVQGGCLPGYALLQSTLECFYNQACLATVKSYTSGLDSVSVLNPMESSTVWHFNRTIAEIFDQLMIESWNNQSYFHKYYHTCAPQSCTYSYRIRFYWIYMITTFIGLLGGLSASVNVIALRLQAITVRIFRTRPTHIICRQPSPRVLTERHKISE